MSKDTIIEAQTFTCQYVQREDRLLLTVNYEYISNRIDFWITRSFLHKLLPYFFDFLSHLDTEILPNQETSNNYSNPTDTSTFILTQKEPILLDSVDLKREKNGSIKIVLKSLKEGVFCTALLEQGAFESLVNLITKSAPVFEWGTYRV